VVESAAVSPLACEASHFEPGSVEKRKGTSFSVVDDERVENLAADGAPPSIEMQPAGIILRVGKLLRNHQAPASRAIHRRSFMEDNSDSKEGAEFLNAPPPVTGEVWGDTETAWELSRPACSRVLPDFQPVPPDQALITRRSIATDTAISVATAHQ
jgi:hypothetical protein